MGHFMPIFRSETDDNPIYGISCANLHSHISIHINSWREPVKTNPGNEIKQICKAQKSH